MFLSYLNRKEKLKFIDLAVYMVDIDGEPTQVERRIIKKMLAELDDIVPEYTFAKSESISETVTFFESCNQVVKNIVFLNLVTISMEDDLYNTEEHIFLEEIKDRFSITAEKRRDLMSIVYEERDLRERASRVIKTN